MDLSLLLGATIGVRWLKPLANEGAHTIDDVAHLTEEDLRKIGMTTVDIRRLHTAIQTHAIQAWSLWSTPWTAEPLLGCPMGMELPSLPDPPPGLEELASLHGHGAAGDSRDLPPSSEEVAVLQEALTEAECEAILTLDICCTDQKPEIASCAVQAQEQLSQTPPSTVLAINAMNAIERALSLAPSSLRRRALQEAQILTRDIVVLRCQMGVPLGSRPRFVNALREAFGGEFPPGALAQMMHAHGKVVCPLFKYAFVSLSRKENAARRHGPRGKRTRDLKRQQALAEAALEAPTESI